MTQATGAQATFALYEEDAYGADPGVPDGQKAYLSKFGLQKKQNRIDSEVLTGGRGVPEPFLGNIAVDGALDTEIGAESIGLLLKHSMGANVTTGAGPYVHTMTVGDLPLALTCEVDYGANISGSGRYIKYNGCRVASAAFDFPTEGACTVSFNMIGAEGVKSATPLDATLTDNGHTTFSAFSASIDEGGVTSAQVKSVNFTIDNTLDEDGFVIGGNGVRQALPEGTVKIRGSLTAIFEDTVLMNKSLDDTESSLKITLSRGDGLGSAGNESLEFLIQQLKYSPATPPVEGPRGVLITLDFIGYKKAADLGLQLVLKNAVATI